jgi:hypothetical protein
MAAVHVLVDTSATLVQTFQYNGLANDLDTGVPTVTATYPDGTLLTPAPTATHVEPAISNVGKYQVVLDPQPEVTWLDLEWSGPIGAKTQRLRSRVEWVGALLFTLEDLRNHPVAGGTPFTDTGRYPNEKLLKVRAEVLGEFTKRLGFAPVPRFEYETHDVGWSGAAVILKRHYPIRLLSLSVAGVAQTIGGYHIGAGGVVLPVANYYATSWTSYGYGVAAVGYSHGWGEFEDDQGREAALTRAAMKLNPGLSSTMTSFTAADGGSYNWDRAGTRNAAGEKVHFGVGLIAEWINEHKMTGAGVA